MHNIFKKRNGFIEVDNEHKNVTLIAIDENKSMLEIGKKFGIELTNLVTQTIMIKNIWKSDLIHRME